MLSLSNTAEKSQLYLIFKVIIKLYQRSRSQIVEIAVFNANK